MKTVNIPEGSQQVMPYLILPGAAGFSDFTQKVFDAEEVLRTMRDETTIQHAELMIGKHKIMFCDSTETYLPQPASLFVYVDNCDAVYQKALNAGAAGITPPADMDYGRSAGVKDVFGNTWWITSLGK